MVVPSWLDKYNNCHLLLKASPAQSDEFSYTKVQDVVTNHRAKTGSEIHIVMVTMQIPGIRGPRECPAAERGTHLRSWKAAGQGSS